MSLEENKAIVRKFFEAVNKRNLAVIDELIAPDYVDNTLQRRGLENLKKFLRFLFKTFPDWYVNIANIIAEGDKVWIRVKYTATHTGEWRGSLPLIPKRNYVLPPTGKKITFTGVHIYHVVHGKVVERESVYDVLDFYKQLGVIEYKGFPDENAT